MKEINLIANSFDNLRKGTRYNRAPAGMLEKTIILLIITILQYSCNNSQQDIFIKHLPPIKNTNKLNIISINCNLLYEGNAFYFTHLLNNKDFYFSYCPTIEFSSNDTIANVYKTDYNNTEFINILLNYDTSNELIGFIPDNKFGYAKLHYGETLTISSIVNKNIEVFKISWKNDNVIITLKNNNSKISNKRYIVNYSISSKFPKSNNTSIKEIYDFSYYFDIPYIMGDNKECL